MKPSFAQPNAHAKEWGLNKKNCISLLHIANIWLLLSNLRKSRLLYIHRVVGWSTSKLIFLPHMMSFFSFIFLFLQDKKDIYLLKLVNTFPFSAFHLLRKEDIISLQIYLALSFSRTRTIQKTILFFLSSPTAKIRTPIRYLHCLRTSISASGL